MLEVTLSFSLRGEAYIQIYMLELAFLAASRC